MLLKSSLIGVLSALAATHVTSQSCVQLNDTTLLTFPVEDSFLTFTLEGLTTVAENTVSLAIIVDGSGSINEDEFLQEQNFTQEIVASFAASNLFANGGNASYVQFASRLVSFGTFSSQEAFDEFVENDAQARGGTNSASGIDQGTVLLGVSDPTAAFMIVITDGGSNAGDDPVTSADVARAQGITVLAVGVGNEVNDEELLGIGGNESNVFSASNFDALDAALADVFEASGGSAIMCPSTGVNLTIEFNVTVIAADPGTIDGDTVTLNADDLEDNPTGFTVVLDLCDTDVGDTVILSADYTDDQGNDPDLSALANVVVGAAITPSPLITGPPSPSFVVTPSPTSVDPPSPPPVGTSPPVIVISPPPTPAGTSAPSALPTPAPSPSVIFTMSPTLASSPAPTPVVVSEGPTSGPTAFDSLRI